MLTALTALSLIPLDFGILRDVRPMFLLTGIYYWALFRPRFLSPFGVFMIGLIYDILAGLPFGLTSLVLIGVYMLVHRQRKLLFSQPFWILWMVYIILTTAAGAITWLLLSLLRFHIMPPMPQILEIFLSAATFPLIVLILKLANPPFKVHLDKK